MRLGDRPRAWWRRAVPADPFDRSTFDTGGEPAAFVKWRRLAVLIIVIGAVTVASLSFEAYYRVRYHSLDWWNSPPRLSWCGRDYNRSPSTGTVSRTEAERFGPLKRVFSVPPLFRSVYASSPRPAPPGGACTMDLFFEQRRGRFVSYSLSGGP